MLRLFIAAAILFHTLAATAQIPKTLYVVNGLAETLSKINLENGTVSNHIVSLGIVPNQVVVRGKIAYLVNSTSSNLQKIDLRADTTLGFVFLGAGKNPWNVVLPDSQTAYVTNFSANSVSKVDLLNDSVLDEIPVGQSPQGLVHFQGKLFICNTGFNPNDFSYGQGTVTVFDPQGDSVVTTINVGQNPQYVKADFKGRLQVICTGDFFSVFGMAYIIDPNSYSVIDSLVLGGTPGQLGISWGGIVLTGAGGYSTNGFVYSYNTVNDSVLHDSDNPILVNLGASDIAVDKSGNVYVACFSASTVDKILPDGTSLDTFLVGDGPNSLAIYDPRPNGDATGDLTLSLGDIIAIVNYIFRGITIPESPAYADCNCDAKVSLADAIWLVNYIFKSGPLPCEF